MQFNLTVIKKIILILSLFVVIFYCLTSEQQASNPTRLDNNKKNIKFILYWMKFFGHDDFYMGFGNVFQSCPFNNCFMTNQKNLMDIEDFDAIMFHGPEYSFKEFGKPGRRSPHQVYIFVDRETPDFYPLKSNFPGFFNWTLTYRNDSDVKWNYGNYRKVNSIQNILSIEQIKKKSKKIAWFVSNCHSKSERHKLYEKINKHIPVDVYGRCGPLKCDRKNDSICYNYFDKDYKFYLSFENSLCEEYVTEKLYRILKRNVVPITYGHVDYKIFAPPHSVIDISSFNSIEDLVKLLKELDEKSEKYQEYFQWKLNYVIEDKHKNMLCSLCEKLNKPEENKNYPDIKEWWHGRNNSKCHLPPEIVH